MPNDFSALANMDYSGRGIIVGATPYFGNPFVGYSLTGRSPSSQARELVFGENTGTIRTNVTDREQLEKGSPALLLYPAVVTIGDVMIASNGAQTKLLYSAVMNAITRDEQINPEDILELAFREPSYEYDQMGDRWIDITTYEPDSPNNTPRISLCMMGLSAAMHIVRCTDGKKDVEIHPFGLELGRGKLITTYKGGNEKPLLPFVSQPLYVTIDSESVEKIAEGLYAAVYGGTKPGDNYRVAAAVMLKNMVAGDIETEVINRSERGS